MARITKTIAAWFSKKTQATPPAKFAEWKKDHKTDDATACKAISLGQLHEVAFTHQNLVNWYKMYKAINGRAVRNKVKILDFFDPRDSAFIGTVFAIEDDEKYIWIALGKKEVWMSEKNAFFTHPAQTFRVEIGEKDNTTAYKAICRFHKKRIVVTAIIKESRTPPTDDDRETCVAGKKLPCSIDQAIEFVNSLKA